ncbi:hypothetical protein MKZ26_08015 [Sporosarcina sp. FSL K6-6792]|uniref:hypothetical protein n=1 Tax=Sporosarcina sp. FSL K6-6792 TaxID=2921559 RepID=UPI0030FCBD2C
MSTKTKEYLKASIIVLILISLIFVLNLPKNILSTLVIIIPIAIFSNEVFPRQNKEGRTKEYIIAILFFLIFATPIYILDLPKKLYLFIGVMSVSFIILYEIFNLIPNKRDEK